ncbi:amidohydrolase family protein [Engelhardtia mirabilis]|uniref:Amidohydrolase-related domain-containing protein n=1 Tax=Engelhardtia mirabilis TaxID=2528011 RepID=A0A518BDJ5_9BACT|nr:hypothetical protein Pla133_01210 [Planctomycetes bacterium Pla133]QDU99384.1 hypothetical protein Pla86_01210 [Planctomycetes bacterium Pla86]
MSFLGCTHLAVAAFTGLVALAPAARAGQQGADGEVLALRFDRVVTCDAKDTVYDPGMILVQGGKLTYVGPPIDAPEGTELVELEGWAIPGMVDLHSHVVTDGWGGINDMVLPANPDLSSAPTIKPSNQQLRLACASGVTTQFLIPGSGTSIGGFGVLFKSKTQATYAECVLADPGGMKVAQAYNPERGGGDVGRTRAGLYWILSRVNREAIASREHGLDVFHLRNLAKVHAKELPVLIHTAGSDGVTATVRMWRDEFPTMSVLSHGSFDGWTTAPYVARMGMPVNHGPRTFDTYARDGRIVGSSREYVEAGVPLFSLNTDAPVIPAHELFLQGSMSARQGLDSRLMLRALTIHPAESFGIGDRVGSLEVGKDADIVVFDGDPIDPRSHVEHVWIDGELQYRPSVHGQWF